ncbi:MAG: signal peptidase I [Lysobacterales bacterium]|jgi:signal peptidase I|nr:MAG: signal peptidase I [Xanthomonadales bacterium]
MHLDFALILVLLTFVSGAIWALDRLFFAPRRARLAQSGTKQRVREPTIVEYSRSLFPVFLIVLLLRSFLAEPFRIPSSSMLPTLEVGDFILVNKFAYGLRLPVLEWEFLRIGRPRRGDVVVFRYPLNPREDYIKRVVGIPGDVVEYRGKRLWVNGEELRYEPVGIYTASGDPGNDGAERLLEDLGGVRHEILVNPRVPPGAVREGRWTLGEGEYFVLGDNRDNSQDSRVWGPVPETHLKGRAFLIWMHWNGRRGGIDFERIGKVIR